MAIIDPILSFFMSNAYADTVAPTVAPAQAQVIPGFSPLLIMLIFLVFIYITIWRPQQKRAKEQRDLLNSLKDGDEVVTIGGVLGKIVKQTNIYVTLTTSESAQLIVQKSAISTVLPKGTIKSI